MATRSTALDGAIMIRIIIVLLFIAAVFISLIVFPELANQRVRIEILGWLFETRTAMFTLLIIFTISGLWALLKAFKLSVNSPKQLWTSLRSGNKKRREVRLQEALAIWIDEGEGSAQKRLKRSKGIVPDWLHEALIIWWDKPSNHPKINDEKDTPLTIALKARLATDPAHAKTLSLSERQQYLDLWLAVHPAAPLAMHRKAELLGKLGEYKEQVHLLESLMQQKKNIQDIKPILAIALLQLSKQDTENKLVHLRKSNRLDPNNASIIKALATALANAGDRKSSERLILNYLQKHDDIDMAKAALQHLSDDPLNSFKELDKPEYASMHTSRWLRLLLAHKAGLSGIANDGLQAMLDQQPTALLWQTKADWLAAEHKWEEATRCYQEAAALSE